MMKPRSPLGYVRSFQTLVGRCLHLPRGEPETQPMRIASNHATAAMACDDNGTCRIRVSSARGQHFSCTVAL